ncbi:MAG: hypothetical protein JXJ20_11575 [Anaerolineae bacterium]|nr:hypothetical protein [Anaerolineae bacterium]
MTNQNSTLFTGRTRGVPVAVFLLSASGLAYEVTLTRLFSLIFQYHYVFLIVSLAIAGLSLGAAIAAFVLRSGRTQADLVNAAVLQALLLVAAAVVLAQLRYADRIAVAVVAALLPFIGIGYLNAALFEQYARHSGVLYAADLIGGAVGLGLALAAISVFGAFNAILALAVLGGVVALILAWLEPSRSVLVCTAGVTLALAVVLVVNLIAGIVDYAPRSIKAFPPDKTMLMVLEQDSTAELTETRWGAFARLDMVETADGSMRYVFTDAGAGSIMVRYSGDDRRVAWLQDEVAYLPFVAMSNPEQPDLQNVLILGAGAGKDVLMAHLARAEAITAVEINGDLVDLTREQSDYNGGVYDLPGVETVVGDGRNFVERSDDQYDLIYANLVYSQAAAPGNSALAESYIFTREALQTYWGRLSENGRIGFVTHHGIEGLRLLVAALDMLEHEGMTLPDALDHVVLVSLYGDDAQTRTSVVMITRQPWDAQTANAFADAAHARNTGVMYLPVFQEQGLEGLVTGMVSLRKFIDDNADEYNFTPTTDDRPFFYQFVPGMPDQLADLLLISTILTGVYLSWNMFFFLRREQHWKRVGLAPYFAALGVGFMLVEVPLIQSFSLLLGRPVLALTIVIGVLLLGGGLGSLFESRFPVPRLPRLVPAAAMGVALAVVVLRFVLPALIEAALPVSLAVRGIVTAAVLLPLGFVMGMLFPGGLRIAHEADPQSVAAFWGANAVASVLGSTVAMVLAIDSGFSAALVLGAVVYALAALMSFVIWPRLIGPAR